jgi:G3E family GTPase
MGTVTRMAEITPVTVLTGFLGVGKTTVLNRLLRRPDLTRAAVLVNEFGETGIDHRLVERIGDATVALNAGCLCCTVRGDLARILRRWLPRARRDDISRVIIETTGLADPVPILATLLSDAVAVGAYRLDGIVTVVDAVNGLTQLDTQIEAERQVAVADRIVLSKSDLADSSALLSRIRKLNPGAPLVVATHGDVDPEFILQGGGFDLVTKEPCVAAWLAAEVATEDQHRHEGHDPNRHDNRIGAFTLTFDRPLSWDRVARWLRELTELHGDRLLRIKGILDLANETRPVVVHGVRHLLSSPMHLAAWPADEARCSRLVFITRDLPRSAVTASAAGILGCAGK